MSRTVTSVTYQGGTSSILYMRSSFSGLADEDVSDVFILWTDWDLSQTTDNPWIKWIEWIMKYEIKSRINFNVSQTSNNFRQPIGRNITDDVNHKSLTSRRLARIKHAYFPFHYLIIKSSVVSHVSLVFSQVSGLRPLSTTDHYRPLLTLFMVTTCLMPGLAWAGASCVYMRLVTEQVLSWKTRTMEKSTWYLRQLFISHLFN